MTDTTDILGRTCSIALCLRPHYGRGFCMKHHRNWWRHGNPLTHREELAAVAAPNHIALSSGQYAIVDLEDVDRVNMHNWYACMHGGKYRVRRSKDNLKLHHFILGTRHQVDHKNRNPLDNRKGNLRLCNSTQNNQNRGPHGGTSQYKGVCWSKRMQKWETKIGFNKKTHLLGYFESEEDAAVAYNVAAKIFFREFAYLNPV